MSYQPTNWKSGDVISSEKLNKIENGIQSASSGGSALYIAHAQLTYPSDDPVIEVTESLSDILQAIASGCTVVMDIEKFGSLRRAYLDAYKLPGESSSGYASFTTVTAIDVMSASQCALQQINVNRYTSDNDWFVSDINQTVTGN